MQDLTANAWLDFMEICPTKVKIALRAMRTNCVHLEAFDRGRVQPAFGANPTRRSRFQELTTAMGTLPYALLVISA
jgi:hypothetical protein